MINPRPIDLIENLIATFDSSILPGLNDTSVLSAATTTRLMLRYVLNQLKHEPESFAAELPRLTVLIGQAQDFFAQVNASAALTAVEAAVAAADTGEVPGHEGLASRIGHLREGLHGVLRQLIDQRDEWSSEPGYAALREAIRQYLVWQNIEEAKIVAPAFYDQGARR